MPAASKSRASTAARRLARANPDTAPEADSQSDYEPENKLLAIEFALDGFRERAWVYENVYPHRGDNAHGGTHNTNTTYTV